MTPPEECACCKASRRGIAEGIAYYACGSVLRFLMAKPRARVTLRCLMGRAA